MLPSSKIWRRKQHIVARLSSAERWILGAERSGAERKCLGVPMAPASCPGPSTIAQVSQESGDRKGAESFSDAQDAGSTKFQSLQPLACLFVAALCHVCLSLRLGGSHVKGGQASTRRAAATRSVGRVDLPCMLLDILARCRRRWLGSLGARSCCVACPEAQWGQEGASLEMEVRGEGEQEGSGLTWGGEREGEQAVGRQRAVPAGEREGSLLLALTSALCSKRCVVGLCSQQTRVWNTRGVGS